VVLSTLITKTVKEIKMKSILIKYTLVGAVIISLTQSACVKKVDGVLVGDKKLSDKSMVQVYMAMVNPSVITFMSTMQQ
jgi:hypothetical protein